MQNDRQGAGLFSWQSPARAACIPAALLIAALTLVLVPLGFVFWTVSPLFWLIPPLWLGGAGGSLCYARLFVKSCRGAWHTGRLFISRGVFWKREWHIALNALREIEWWEPPLHRLASCCTFRLRYAGGSVWIFLMDQSHARRLRQLWEDSL